MCFILLLEFFMEYTDDDSQRKVRSHKRIALKYLKSYLIIDIIATFPYELCTKSYYTSLFRLLRLFRLHELFVMLDFSKSLATLQKLFRNDTRNKRVIYMFFLINLMKIFNLILVTVTILYFIGCIWFIISDTLNSEVNHQN